MRDVLSGNTCGSFGSQGVDNIPYCVLRVLSGYGIRNIKPVPHEFQKSHKCLKKNGGDNCLPAELGIT
jgi:hypothetical protein